MKKRKRGRKLHREKDQRKALLKELAREVILKERIKTTETKAKEVRPFLERMVTKAKKGDLASIRYLARYFSKSVTKKLISEIGPRYKERPGGYTRIIKLGPRKSDSAKMAIMELVK